MSKTRNLLMGFAAAASVLAIASTALAQEADDSIKVSPRDQALYGALKLNPAQNSAWITYQQAIAAPRAGAAGAGGVPGGGGRQSMTPQMQAQAQATATRRVKAAETFRATLNPSQKMLFDVMAELTRDTSQNGVLMVGGQGGGRGGGGGGGGFGGGGGGGGGGR